MNRKTATALVICLALIAFSALSFTLVKTLRTQVPVLGSYYPSGSEEEEETQTKAEKIKINYQRLAYDLTQSGGVGVSSLMLERAGAQTCAVLEEEVKGGEISPDRFRQITGYTPFAFADKYGTMVSRDMGDNGKETFTLGFTGDINFTETGYVMTHAYNMPGCVMDCIDETFQNEMRSADIMFINNEFPYSDRGTRQVDKKYTFRAKPENVKYLNELGVDIVSLANNHTYDYGYESFVDTLETLRNADILYVGAGMTASEANAPVSLLINGYKVSYIACSGVEYPVKTPVATETSCGIMGSYDNGEKTKEAVEKAREDSDYVIVFPHWGFENTTQLTSAQISNSRKWIDAGADAVIGCHAHILQGMDYYKGVPVAYGLGNFWFNTRDVYTVLYKLVVSGSGIEVRIVPGRQAHSETFYLESESERRSLYNSIISWSPNNNISISDEGIITEKKDD
ncbi:MAG: CapA family protein [Clostridia bacterium]|nr:CapA family protein [Clostridia bacterium]